MSKIKISFIFLFFVISLLIFTIPKDQLKNKIKHIYYEYIPIHSKNELDNLLNEQNEYLKRIAINSFDDFISPENMKLTLTKLPESKKNINDNLKVIKYKANFLNLEKRIPEVGPSYIALNNKKIFIMQENGLLFLADMNEFGNEIIEVSLLKSNLNNFTKYFDFYAPGQFGVKDILIHDGNFYVAFIRELEHKCFNTSVLKSELSEVLNFSILYSSDECIHKDSLNEFNAHQSGGRMHFYKDKKILLTVGDYRNRSLSQNLKTDFGKILSIDITSGKTKIISSGHRNPQGLFYSSKHDDMWSTEHGPFGGDELNWNPRPEKSEIKNFGWPISSYGAHYGSGYYEKSDSKMILKEDRKNYRYKNAPLFKNHEKYGFEEPRLYFSPSVGISQIIEIDTKYSSNQSSRALMFGTMGYAVSEFTPSMSLFIISLDESDQIIEKKQMIMNERIRDLIYDSKMDEIYFSGDSNAIIGKILFCNDQPNC